jgi:hypothetical protein
MPKLIILVIGLVFAFIGYRKTWYPSWAFLFNVLIAVYLGVMTASQIVDRFSIVREYLGDYSYSALIFMVAVIIFIVLQLLSFKFFTAVFVVSFPRILNTAGAAFLGFLTGSVLAGFLFFLITITPLSDFPVVKLLTQGKQTPSHINGVVLTSCDFVHGISLQADPKAIDNQMEKILTGYRRQEIAPQAQDTKSPAGSEPNKTENNE